MNILQDNENGCQPFWQVEGQVEIEDARRG
jgi:hypothetical protein